MARPESEPLLSVFENDPEVGEIVALFVTEMPERCKELEQAAKAGDAAQATRTAHQLKGAAGGYGFESLGQLASAVEHTLRDLMDAGGASASAIQAAVAPLIDACGRVRLANPGAAA